MAKRALLFTLLLAFSAFAQTDPLGQAEASLNAARAAGAVEYARSLYDDAAFRLRSARENWNVSKSSTRDEARMRAAEALWASRAALAKARWIGTNEAIRTLQSDIQRMGGTAEVRIIDESPNLEFSRGTDSRARINFAQAIVDQAIIAGGDKAAPDDLKSAQQNLDAARKVTRHNANSSIGDHLSYIAEMMARHALYTARGNNITGQLAPLQLQRTQLARTESERLAASERQQREQAEQARRELERRLAAEQANRQAQAAEVERLRQQIDASRRAMQQRLDEDRAARLEAERRLDEAFARYERAITSGTATEVEQSRRELEDRQIALRAIQQREQMSEESLASDIERMRNEIAQSGLSQSALSERQSALIQRQREMDTYRQERAAALESRLQADQQRQAAIAAAQRRRQEADLEAQRVARELAAAQQAAQEAQLAAASAQQQVQQTQAELEQSRQQIQQTQAEIERTRQEQQQTAEQLQETREQAERTRLESMRTQTELQQRAQQTEAELERTRRELAEKDAEAQRLRMEAELARIAATRSDDRGFIVTLSSALFDSGRSALKAGAKNTLTKIAEQLRANPSATVTVEGHTDDVGSEESNRALSEKRAQAVRDFLVSAGVAESNVTAVGRGESAPVATNRTAAGRQQNRRVELVVTNR